MAFGAVVKTVESSSDSSSRAGCGPTLKLVLSGDSFELVPLSPEGKDLARRSTGLTLAAAISAVVEFGRQHQPE
jgi:hypothetical protein